MAAETTTTRPARHPLIYTAEEAAAYLGLDDVSGLEAYRRDFGLIGHRPAGKGYSYWRPDLDAAADRAYGAKRVENRTEKRQLRLAGGGR